MVELQGYSPTLACDQGQSQHGATTSYHRRHFYYILNLFLIVFPCLIFRLLPNPIQNKILLRHMYFIAKHSSVFFAWKLLVWAFSYLAECNKILELTYFNLWVNTVETHGRFSSLHLHLNENRMSQKVNWIKYT